MPEWAFAARLRIRTRTAWMSQTMLFLVEPLRAPKVAAAAKGLHCGLILRKACRKGYEVVNMPTRPAQMKCAMGYD